jgi:hypothetical protein
MRIAGIVSAALLPVGGFSPTIRSMDKQGVSRRVAEANRLLVEGRRTADRQRDLMARLERMGINATKPQALLSILLQEQKEREERLAELLSWFQSQPDQKPGGQDIGAKVERDRFDYQVSDA